MMLGRFNNQAFEDFTAGFQVTYLLKKLRKLVGLNARICIGRFQENSTYLDYFPGLYSKYYP